MRREHLKRLVTFTVKTLYRHARAKNGSLNSDDYNVQRASRAERPAEIDRDEIKTLVDANRRYVTRDVAEIPKRVKTERGRSFKDAWIRE